MQKMRNGTFIIPSTGERSRRQFTLRSSSSLTPNISNISSSASDTGRDRIRAAARDAELKVKKAWQWLNSDEGHGVLKCTLAYLLGSTATFWSPLSNFLGHRDGKHVVATLTVYFHPARTAGSMIEAVMIAIVAVAYAEIVCVLSMAVSIASRSKLGSAVPAHIIVLIFFIGGGLGFIGWVKQKLNQPLVNVASTLASIAIISVVTKEESVQDGYFSEEKILQMLKMLVIGISFSAAVNLLVWRISARKILRKSINTASLTLSARLSFVARGFLNGSDEEVNSKEYDTIRKQYNTIYTAMPKTLREAKLEYYFLGQERMYRLDKRLFKSLDAVYQAIGGLRSALNTQFTLLRESSAAQTGGEQGSDGGPLSPTSSHPSPAVGDRSDRLSIVIEEDSDEQSAGAPRIDNILSDNPAAFATPSDIFAFFMALLGPSMKSLAYTLSEILQAVPFGEDDLNREVRCNEQLRESLREALNLYNETRGHSLRELYKTIEMGRARSEKIQADIEEVAAACGHFSFSLQAVAEEMDTYLDALEDLYHCTEHHRRSWSWLKIWKFWPKSSKSSTTVADDPESVTLLGRKTSMGIRNSALPKGIPQAMVKRRDTFNWDASPESSDWSRKISQVVLGFLRFFAKEDILFGVKVGIGAILWAMFAFIPGTRPSYQHWRGEWGLLSYMIVVGMTTGASNTTGTARFIGTLIGATCACFTWVVSGGNNIVLAGLGCVLAFWNFYMILVVKNGPLGRISLLAYNVIVLYAYSLSQNVDDDDDDEGGTNPLIFNITYHRVVAVTLGIVWGISVCRLLWPISGRTKFREGLAVLYLQLGLIWKRGPLTVLMETNNTLDYLQEGEQAALQRYGKYTPLTLN